MDLISELGGSMGEPVSQPLRTEETPRSVNWVLFVGKEQLRSLMFQTSSTNLVKDNLWFIEEPHD